ncbi:unnamed protein product (macronuclear) [Paramecium tetraurelia]|uniref:Uncharacterized protein n=1 Tax=Paramecium tetraurelia TaxID=5888 RepID=A0C800_PARTE|nr:uncharacterized protein GSPATT00036048001 [Paramecium tetraurelia]CAK66917.1 unnamed protein product [Paramecium tetraurelia]|eukprot:XP_001434314.1 hypothetical protein (macronuclear) [Paramecium tetraurelia strain d4-2]
MAEISNQSYFITAGRKVKLIYKSIPNISNLERQTQVENQRRGNRNNLIPTRQNEDQFNDCSTLLQKIEDLLVRNYEKFKSQIEQNADQLLDGYVRLQWLVGIAFKKTNCDLRALCDELKQQIEEQNKQISEKQQIIQKMSNQAKEDIAAEEKKIKELNQTIRQLKEKQQEFIQQKENLKNKLEAEIGHLTINQQALQLQITKKDEIFQQILDEEKQKCTEALNQLNLKNEVETFKNSDERLQLIIQKEVDIEQQTEDISIKVNDILKITQQNFKREKWQQIKNQFSSTKDQITAVIKSLEQYIQKQRRIWGSAIQVDSALNSQVKHNIEIMMAYSKIFENFYKTVEKLIELLDKYQIVSNLVQIERNNENLNNNPSPSIQPRQPKNENQTSQAQIETQSNDTIKRNVSKSATILKNLDRKKKITHKETLDCKRNKR